MQDDLTMYSEEHYVDKQYLYSLYSYSAADLIWQDILEYRKFFCHELYFDEKRYYVTMNRSLFLKMLRIYEYQVENVIMDYPKIHLFVENHANMDVKSLLILYAQEIQLSLKPQMIHFLCSDENLLIKLFVAKQWIQSEEYIYLILLVFNKISWYHYTQDCQELIGITAEKDVTYKYRNFLDQLYYQFSNSTNEIAINQKEKPLEELLSRFPMCNKMQITFYLSHCDMNHYYTVKQYREYHHVSYETARKAMNLLHVLGFYGKATIGKKQVYRPL